MLSFISISVFGQQEKERVLFLEKKLDSLELLIPELSKKVDFSFNNAQLPTMLRAIADTHKVNLSIDTDLKSYNITNNFIGVSVKDVLLYLCSKYSLTIKSIGNILSVEKFQRKIKKKTREIIMAYNSANDSFSIDLKKDTLSVALKKITDLTGKNLVYAIGLENKILNGYIKNKPLEGALEKLAFTNNLNLTKTNDDYYLFESIEENTKTSSRNNKARKSQKQRRYKNSNFYFAVKDSINQILEVDFDNIAIGTIIKDIGYELNIDMFTGIPLTGLSTISFKSKKITFDRLLSKIFEKETTLSYKKEDGIYYFSKIEDELIKNYVTIPLIHRSIEIMTSLQSNSNNSSYSNVASNNNLTSTSSNLYNNTNTQNTSNNNRRNLNTSNNNNSFQNYNTKADALVSILPTDITKDLDIKTDTELNSFIVGGDSQKIEKFKAFIKKIDKPVPVILIEVMILEVSRFSTLETGIDVGVGNTPTTSSGQLFPEANVTLGASAINKILGSFNSFSSLNIGKVTSNFYATIEAMESNGNVKIKSTPKLSTLNGHQATLSNGEQSYYAITTRDIIGTQNPLTTETKNYYPIEADLSITLKPMVAGDNQITMSINVVQSSFNDSETVDDEAPPGISSREFTSIIRVKDQDVVVLGGLETKTKNDTGSGVPFLSKIPILKWFFSSRTRIDSKKNLSVLIKPTIIR